MQERVENSDSSLMDILSERGAILSGHFLLSSGLHSDTYIQCAKLIEVPEICERLCSMLIKKSVGAIPDDFDMIVSPALGAVVFGYEVARQLGRRYSFVERVDGSLTFRRGFGVERRCKVVIVEDVLTTGKSSMEVYDAVTAAGGYVLGELCLIKRDTRLQLPFTVVSLLELDIRSYSEAELPAELRDVPISKPGSRFIS